MEFSGARLTGKYWPRFWPLEAVTNGSLNNDGAGLPAVVPIGRVRGQYAKAESPDRGIEHSEAGAHAGFAGTADNFTDERIGIGMRSIDQADAWRKFIAWRREGASHPGVGGIKNSFRRAGENYGLVARLKSRNLIVFFVPRLDAVPAQAVVQCEIGAQAPTVLSVEAGVAAVRP